MLGGSDTTKPAAASLASFLWLLWLLWPVAYPFVSQQHVTLAQSAAVVAADSPVAAVADSPVAVAADSPVAVVADRPVGGRPAAVAAETAAAAAAAAALEKHPHCGRQSCVTQALHRRRWGGGCGG